MPSFFVYPLTLWLEAPQADIVSIQRNRTGNFFIAVVAVAASFEALVF